jgi:hypothetical protein
MIKNKGNNMGRVEDMGVISYGREETHIRNPRTTTQSVKMN